MRRRNIKNATEKLNKFDEVMIFNPKGYKGNMNSLFPNKQPIHLEIGMGKGDFIIENALKYGDGQMIFVEFADEENCKLVSVKNTGCDLPENEILSIFDCFYRGTNSKNKGGSGLGLHICKSLMHKMNGDIFAEISGDVMAVTLVFNKA